MKTTLTSIIFALFFFTSFAQNTSEEIDPIQQFIEATVQIPFLAQFDNIQGDVEVRIAMGDNNFPAKYEIVKSLRSDCDTEALRVVKLINPKYLLDKLGAKKVIILQVPFINSPHLSFVKNYIVEYFNQEKKPVSRSEKPKYARRYMVDTLSGKINGYVENFIYKDVNPELIEIVKLYIDTCDSHCSELLVSPTDLMKIYRRDTYSDFIYPSVTQAFYQNGRLADKNLNDRIYRYYPSGSIASVSSRIKEDKNEGIKTIKWYANGLMASISINIQDKTETYEGFISVWDSLGKQTVKDGEGFYEYSKRDQNGLIHYSGSIKGGFKHGKWKGRNSLGEILFEENYQDGECLNGFSLVEGNKYEYTNPIEKAEYSGGTTGFIRHLQLNLKYPGSAQRNNVQGKVYVQFTVCTDGTLSDYNVLKGIGFGCDQEAVRIIRLMNGKWLSGKVRGKEANTQIILPFNFKLAE